MRHQLTKEQERAARDRADLSDSTLYFFIIALLLVAAFCAFMVATGG